jgi:hypothetical protein
LKIAQGIWEDEAKAENEICHVNADIDASIFSVLHDHLSRCSLSGSTSEGNFMLEKAKEFFPELVGTFTRYYMECKALKIVLESDTESHAVARRCNQEASPRGSLLPLMQKGGKMPVTHA